MATVTGELGGQPILLENAATEATLNALLQATLANSNNKSQAAKIQQAYEEAVKRTTKKQNDNREAIEKEEQKRKDLNKQITEEKERREKMAQGMAEAATALKNFGQTLGNLVGGTISMAFNSATPKISDFTDAVSGIPIIGPIIGAVGKAMQDQIDKYRELTTVGADFGNGINYINTVAARAGLSLETYTKTIVNNGESLALLGGSTTAGAKIFTKINESLQGPFQESLARLGFSMEETAEYTAGYLAMQTRMGRAQRMTQEELNEGTKQYLLELDMLSRVTGMTRKEAQAELEAQQRDTRLKLFSAQLEKGGGVLATFLGSIPKENQKLKEAMVELVVQRGVATSDFAKELVRTKPEIRDLAVRLGRNNVGLDEAYGIMRRSSSASKEYLNTQGQNMALLNSLNGVTGAAHAEMLGLSNMGAALTEEQEKQKKAMEDERLNRLNADKALLEMRNMLMNSLMPTFSILAGVIMSSIDSLNKFVRQILTIVNGPEGVRGALVFVVKEIGSIIGSALADMISGPAVAGAIIAGIGLLWAAGAIKMAIVKGIKDAFDSAKSGPKPGQYGNWESSMPEGPSESKGKGKWLGRLKNLVKGGGVGILGTGAEIAGEKLSEAGHTRSGAALDIAGSTAQYAGLGAMLGSIFPGLGTAIGAGIGGTIGLGAGLWSSGSKLWNGGSKPPASNPSTDSRNAAAAGDPRRVDLNKDDPGLQTAAILATTTTPAQVKELAAALKDLDYSKLIVPAEAHTSMETGVLKMRQLRGEVNAMTTAFKDLNNTGLDKITKGLGRLDESFKSFNKSFVEDFITKFKELDKKSQEQLLTDLNDKMDLLNTSVKSLVEIEEESSRHVKNTARNTKNASGRVN